MHQSACTEIVKREKKSTNTSKPIHYDENYERLLSNKHAIYSLTLRTV